jgi:hypothetical protein
MMMGVLVGLGRSRLGLGLRVRTLGLKRLVSALYDTVEHLRYSSRRVAVEFIMEECLAVCATAKYGWCCI